MKILYNEYSKKLFLRKKNIECDFNNKNKIKYKHMKNNFLLEQVKINK